MHGTLSSLGAGPLQSLIVSDPLRVQCKDYFWIIHFNKLNILAAGCAIVTIFEALIIGAIGSFLANVTDPLLVWLRVDDAVGATCVHGFGGAWGLIAVGLFAKKDIGGYCQYDGLFHGGGYYLLSIQSLMVLALTVWAAVITFIMLGV